MAMMTVQDRIAAANEKAEKNELFWLAGQAKEEWSVLQNHLSELHPVARSAVEHYRDHLPSCRNYDEAGKKRCKGCRA